MDAYHQTKTTRRVAAMVYLVIMLFILGGTYLSEQQKANTAKAEIVPRP